MKIVFKLVDEQHIDVMSDDKRIGHIFTPSGTGECFSNAIQICGFEEAFDLWGCGVFGEEITEQIRYDKEHIKRLRNLAVSTGDNFWNILADKGFHLEKNIVMKRDIQLRFKDYTAVRLPMFASIKCYECFNNPCNCDKKYIYRSNVLNLYGVKKNE